MKSRCGILILLVALAALLFASLPAAAPASVSLNSYEQQLVKRINKERAKFHLASLRVNAKLVDAARAHSADMGDRQYFDHNSPSGESWSQRIVRHGYTRQGYRVWKAGENIAWGAGLYSSPVLIVDQWMKSSMHRAVILTKSFRDLGVGAVHRGLHPLVHDQHRAGVQAGAPCDVRVCLPDPVALTRVAVTHDALAPRLTARRVVVEVLPVAHVGRVRTGRVHELGVDAQTGQVALGALLVDALHELLLVGVQGDAGGGRRGHAREQQGGQRHQQDHDPAASLHGSPPSPAVVYGCPLLVHPSNRGIGRDQQKLRVSAQVLLPPLATPEVEARAGLRRSAAAASANAPRLAASGAAL